MLEDKVFLEKEITPSVAKLISEIKIMIAGRVPIPKIYAYILRNAKDHREMYMVLFLFGMAYQGYKEDLNLK
jgi:hypothetical protein